ncbi:aldose epimerase family protein [Companilactobacillus sp.]|jgi:aldose 1-epimerase|uniref:aldose epimerase family protein n=1 Tax=Companilactobacillus sp. TaxID=2767905 RepID=UPI0025BC06FF|nr:aldose epimerase family protein [Companilactobacillus sp.]MCH4008175.1 galactose mutarotase [Companilactobacillus sp.]MCH4051646.1 galactose mutarotase [Companilactobacillus sp.]MCH4076118.1 galactose mutarotase [Companilactobacillus sp.]MCH4124693.1 galactose mutarotase [Companilactobacillus sp.]MCH4131235.1 galactose mutarotase [Companilactobacillus sp.]
MIKVTNFGQANGEDVQLYTIENDHKTKLSVISYAAAWQNFEVVEDGVSHSLIEHYDTVDGYIDNPYQVGKTVGRVAGRIGNAKFEINGKQFHLPANEGDNLLHGGNNGIQTHNFVGTVDEKNNSVTLKTTMKSAEDHFPGDLDLTITYTLTKDDEVLITYTGKSTEATLFNPTCHVYFNVLNDTTDVSEQKLQINADESLAVYGDKVPTGRKLPVTSGYDFRQPRTIGQGLKDLYAENEKIEFDDCYVTGKTKSAVAELSGDGRAVDLYSDRNGMVIFTANPQDDDKAAKHEYSCLATELQTLPDAINHKDFGDIVLPANQEKSFTNKYKYIKK